MKQEKSVLKFWIVKKRNGKYTLSLWRNPTSSVGIIGSIQGWDRVRLLTKFDPFTEFNNKRSAEASADGISKLMKGKGKIK